MINNYKIFHCFFYFIRRNEKKVNFLLIGILNTLVGLTLFPFMVFLCRPLNIGYMYVFVVSYFISSAFSFLTNKNFVFKSTGNYFQEYIKFMSFHMGHFFINLFFLPLIVESFSISPIIAQLIFASLVIISSFFWYKKITFT